MYQHFEFLLLHLQLSQYIFDKTITTDTPKSCEVTHFIHISLITLTIFAYILCWHYAQCFCHPIMLIKLMLA